MTPEQTLAVWDALREQQHAPDLSGYRLHLYVARVAFQAAAEGDWHVYARLRRGLIASGYWAEDASVQVHVPAQPPGE